jgi:hypothetical protein
VAKVHVRRQVRNGKRRFYYSVRTRGPDGKVHEYGSGFNREEADDMRDWYSALERRVRHGMPLPNDCTWTMTDLKKHDLAQHKAEGGEIPSRERRWRQIIAFFGKDELIDRLTPTRILAFTTARLKRAGPGTIRRDRAVLKKALTRAGEPGTGSSYEGNPFTGLDSMARAERLARKPTRPHPPETIERVIAAARALRPPRGPKGNGLDAFEWRQNAEILELIYLTASRSSQIFRLRRDQRRVHPTLGPVLWFPPHKRGTERHFLDRGRLRTILDAIPKSSEWFFPSRRAEGKPREGFERFLKLAVEASRVKDLSEAAFLRSLRKSKATADFVSGKHPAEVQLELGHSGVGTTMQWYTEVFPRGIEARWPSPPGSPRKSQNRAKSARLGRAGLADFRANASGRQSRANS